MATLEERKNEYDTHKIAGYDLYNSMRAQLSLGLEEGSLTTRQVLDVQKKMAPVKDELVWGDWKTALLRIEEVTPNENLSSEFIAQIKTAIQAYIVNNYKW